MTDIRLFIAISLPAEFQAHLKEVSRELRENLAGVSIRWVPVRNMHLTLKFLGNVAEDKLEQLRHTLKDEAGRHASFDIGLGGLGAFPSLNRPRVLWIGITAPKELITLAQGIDRITEKIGYAGENRPYSPHLTLGRVGQNVSANGLHRIRDTVLAVKPVFSTTTRVTEIHLYCSDLQPSGAIYTRLHTVTLV